MDAMPAEVAAAAVVALGGAGVGVAQRAAVDAPRDPSAFALRATMRGVATVDGLADQVQHPVPA